MNRIYLYTFFVLVFTTSVLSQGPVKELEIEVNGNPHVMEKPGEGLTGSSIFDVNGDGVRDLIVSPRDPASGQATGFLVKSGNSSQVWEYPIPTSTGFEEIVFTYKFIGFYEMNNDSPEKEALFARKVDRSFTDVVVLSQTSIAYELKGILLSSISDIDDDGIEELQLYNTQTGLLEIWGPGPQLELFPANFSLENFTMVIDTTGLDTMFVVNYLTQVNSEKRNVVYTFLKNQTVDISILDGNRNVLLTFNSSEDFWSLPEVDDEVLVWLVTQNLIKSTSVGLAAIWLDVKDSFSEESRSAVGSALGGIGGIIGAIPGIVDILCRASGTATCTDDFGTVSITCDCGVPSCVTQQVTVTVRIRETNPSTGEVTEREEIQTKEKCVCTCLKLRETKG